MSNEPFDRQPLPVKVTLEGDPIDVENWMRVLKRSSEYKGDATQRNGHGSFTIYPRAVND